MGELIQEQCRKRIVRSRETVAVSEAQDRAKKPEHTAATPSENHLRVPAWEMGLSLSGSRKGVLVDKHGLHTLFRHSPQTVLCSTTNIKHFMCMNIMPQSRCCVSKSEGFALPLTFTMFNSRGSGTTVLTHPRSAPRGTGKAGENGQNSGEMGGSSPWTRPSAHECAATPKAPAGDQRPIYGGDRLRRRLRGRYRLGHRLDVLLRTETAQCTVRGY